MPARSNDAWKPWLPNHDLSSPEGRAAHAQVCKAVQQMAQGECPPEGQKRLLEYIIHNLCGTYDLEFRPGADEGERASVFAGGKRFVGMQLVLMLKLSVAHLLAGWSAKPTEQGK